MDVFLLGAGASKSYSASPTGVKMPLAKEVFATFDQLDVAASSWVLIGEIITYARDKMGVELTEVFRRNFDIEAFHSEVEADLQAAIEKQRGKGGLNPEILAAQAVFTQLIFFFACVLNEIQNGPISPAHLTLAGQVADDDVVITFNWDTLFDRAMQESGRWHVDYGYTFVPTEVFRDGWFSPRETPSKGFPKLLKLHGSTNWITSYLGVDHKTYEHYLIQEAPSDVVRVFEYATKPYATFAGRYIPGYVPFSYGYYPPNITSDTGRKAEPDHVFVRARPKYPWRPEGTASDEGIPAMPLIIPPVKQKSYTLFGSLFRNLWTQAEEALQQADRIFVIGYSFPLTDVRSVQLFKDAFLKRKSIPRVIILNPNPDAVADLFAFQLGIPATHLEIRRAFFDESFRKDHIT